MEGKVHKDLKREAVKWLSETGCFIVSEEVFYKSALIDAVGIKRNGISYCIEVKTSQLDLNRGRQKDLLDDWKRNFTFHYLILPKELKPDYEWSGWGIIRNGKVERKAKRFEVDRSFGNTIELIMQMASNLTNKVYLKEL